MLCRQRAMSTRLSETTQLTNARYSDGSKSLNPCDTDLDNEERGRLTIVVDDDHLRALVEANPLTTVRNLSADMSVSVETALIHLKAIGKVMKRDKWTPYELNENQKNRR